VNGRPASPISSGFHLRADFRDSFGRGFPNGPTKEEQAGLIWRKAKPAANGGISLSVCFPSGERFGPLQVSFTIA
jgi:hypothetical protein